MQPKKPFTRFLVGAAAALAVIVIGAVWVGALIPNWGSAPGEAARTLPGDEIVSDPTMLWNHAITIAAPAEDVYPWLVQIGDSRAAFYSITFIENAFCAMSGECRYANAGKVHEEWQSPVKGEQGIIMDYMAILDYAPGEWVLAHATEKMAPMRWTWLWYVEPVDASHARLTVRHRAAFPPEAPRGLVQAVFDAGFVMERAMMLGIKSRAEGRIPAGVEEPLGALIWLLVAGMGIACAARFARRADGYHTLGVGLEAIAVLFVLTYVQPPLAWRFALLLAVAAGVWVAWRRK